MIRIFALALVMFCFAVPPAQAQKPDAKTEVAKPDPLLAAMQESGMRADLFYQALSAAAEKESFNEVRATLEYGLKNGGSNEVSVAVLWLIDHSFSLVDKTKLNALYYLFLSDLELRQAQTAQALGRMDDYNKAGTTALKALMNYEILALSDAERCDDPSVGVAVMSDLLPRYDALAFTYRLITKEEYDLAAVAALDTESNASARPVNLAICRSGDKGKADPNYTPKEVEDWSAKRNYLRVQYKNLWSDQYYQRRDPKKP